MSEFASNVHERVREARSALDTARSEGDEYLVSVHTGELESLARLAQDNDVDLPAGETASTTGATTGDAADGVTAPVTPREA